MTESDDAETKEKNAQARSTGRGSDTASIGLDLTVGPGGQNARALADKEPPKQGPEHIGSVVVRVVRLARGS